MTGSGDTPMVDQVEMFLITYDERGNEARLLPVDSGAAAGTSRNLEIGLGRREVIRVKHRPFVAP
jgi:hypothetical protein